MPRAWIMIVCLVFALSPIPGCKGKSQDPTPKADTAQQYSFRKDGDLSVIAKDGTIKAQFDIEIAEHEEDLQRGLKYRESMQDNQGMLFVFDGKQSYGFWMKDTYIPLDMLFIDYEQNIFQIASHTTPFSEEAIEPQGFNKYTLEINAGLVEKLSINEGDKIEWKRTDTSSPR